MVLGNLKLVDGLHENYIKYRDPIWSIYIHTVNNKCLFFIACVDFNFAVESNEHDLFRNNIRQSQSTAFKSEAVPRLVRFIVSV